MNFDFSNAGYDEIQRKRDVIANILAKQPTNAAGGITKLIGSLLASKQGKALDAREGELKQQFNDQFSSLFSPHQRDASVNPAQSGVTTQPISTKTEGEGVADDTVATLLKMGLEDRGLPAHVAEGFSMNARDESGFRTDINETAPIVPGSRGGFGLFQWTGPRRVELENFAASRGKPVSDFDTQLDFLMQELSGSEKGAARSILSSKDAPEAATAIVNDFLRPAAEHRERRSAKYQSGASRAIAGGASVQNIMSLLSSPMATPEQKGLLTMLLEQRMSQPKQTDDMREYELARTQGYTGTFAEYQRDIRSSGATKITNNNGSGEVGTIPQGYELFTDPQTGARSFRAIPGGPADTSGNEKVAQENKERSGGVVTDDISRALSIVRENPSWTTGMGAWLKRVPGTDAKALSGLIETIKANVGFDRLQQMRDASKTGGALGAINQTEMQLLTSALGNLEQSLSDEDLTYNLNRINSIYMDIIHGKGNWEQPSAPIGFDAMSADDILGYDVMSIPDDQLDAYKKALEALE